MNKSETRQGALIVFLLGLIIIGIGYKYNTGIANAYVIEEDGGLKAFLAYRIMQVLCGETLLVSLDPVGYILIIIGVIKLHEMNKKVKIATCFSAAGAVFSILEMILPQYISAGGLMAKVSSIVYIGEGVCIVMIVYAVVQLAKAKVDSYYNMEVAKDLTFAAEIIGFSYFVKFILMLIEAVGIGVISVSWCVTICDIIMLGSVIYFSYKIIVYNRKLLIFK